MMKNLVILFALLFWMACSSEKLSKYTVGEDVVWYPEDRKMDADAERLGLFLRDDGYFDNTGMEVKMLRIADTFIVMLRADTAAISDDQYLALCRDYTASLCREVFAGKTTDIWLCNEDFEVFHKVPCILPPAQRKPLNGLNVNGNLLYFSPAIEEEELKVLADFLIRDSFFTKDEGILAEFDRSPDRRIFRFVISEAAMSDPEYRDVAQAYAVRLSDSCFAGAPVAVHLCDRNLQSVFETATP
jgi:hypothetical protein